jgi:hypothetical protein
MTLALLTQTACVCGVRISVPKLFTLGRRLTRFPKQSREISREMPRCIYGMLGIEGRFSGYRNLEGLSAELQRLSTIAKLPV